MSANASRAESGTGGTRGYDIKFPKSSKIEKLVSSDATQRVLANPWLDTERGVILSSSGQNAIILPVTVEEGDVSGPIPLVALKEIRKDGSSLKCTKEYCILPSGAAHPREQQFTQYPPIEKLVSPSSHASMEVSLNAKLLSELAQGMGTDVIKLRIQIDDASGDLAEGAPYIVMPHPTEPHVDGAMGALLPYRVARV